MPRLNGFFGWFILFHPSECYCLTNVLSYSFKILGIFKFFTINLLNIFLDSFEIRLPRH